MGIFSLEIRKTLGLLHLALNLNLVSGMKNFLLKHQRHNWRIGGSIQLGKSGLQ